MPPGTDTDTQPWLKYAQPAAQSDSQPWLKYGSAASSTPAPDDIAQQQEAAKTAAGAPIPKPVLPKPEFGPSSPQEALLHGNPEINFEQWKGGTLQQEAGKAAEQNAAQATAAGGMSRSQEARQAALGMMRDAGALGASVASPKGIGLTAATAFAPEVMLPYWAYQGQESILQPRGEGETQADALQRRLLGGAQVAGAFAGAAERPDTSIENVRDLFPAEGRQAAAERIVRPLSRSTIAKEASAEKFGHSGERAIVKEPLGAHVTEGGMREAVGEQKETVGKAIGDTLQLPQNKAQTFDRQPIVDAEYAKAEREAQMRGDQGTVTKLGAVRDAMLETNLFGPTDQPLPNQHEFNTTISGHTEFTDNKAGDAIVNRFRQGVRRGVQNEIVTRVPELGGEGGLNKRYGDLADEWSGMEAKRRSENLTPFLKGGAVETAGRVVGGPAGRYALAKFLSPERYGEPTVATPIFQGQVMPPNAPTGGQPPPYAAPPIPHNTQPQLPPGASPKMLGTGGPAIVTPPPDLTGEPYYDWRTGGPAEPGPTPQTVNTTQPGKGQRAKSETQAARPISRSGGTAACRESSVAAGRRDQRATDRRRIDSGDIAVQFARIAGRDGRTTHRTGHC